MKKNIILFLFFILFFPKIPYASIFGNTIEFGLNKFSCLGITIIKRNMSNKYLPLPDIHNVKDAIDIMDALRKNTLYFNPKELPISCYPHDIPYPFGMWFRGASKKFYNLQPSVFRKIYPESTLINEFKLKNPEDHNNFDDAFSWLTLAQHHSLPTRLLDWSESILTALYFAVDQYEKNSYGKLYILNAVRLNQYVLEKKGFGICPKDDFQVTLRAEMAMTPDWTRLLKKKSISSHDDFPDFYKDKLTLNGTELNDFIISQKLNCPLAVMPLRSHMRLFAQQGTFTIQGGISSKSLTLEDLNQECVEKGGLPFLFTIKVHKQQQIFEQLRLLGINKGSVYCDKDSQSHHIREFWEVK
jgi:hypothetical protein